MGLAPGIEVLLATYNGSKFLREQIDSILGQEYGNLTVLARDDGSTDETFEILREYAGQAPNRFKLLEASRINGGIVNNFLALMRASSAAYVCFSDQDDIWLPDKIWKTKTLMDELELRWGPEVPLLVFTDLRVVDEDLATLHPSFWGCMGIDPGHIQDFSSLLSCPVVTGCTMMANRALIELALTMPAEASLHDRWIGLVASAMGKAAFLPQPTVLYRQHAENVIGTGKGETPTSLLQRIRAHRITARSYVAEWQTYQKDAAEFLRVYGPELPAENRNLISAFVRCESSASRWMRLATFFSHRFYVRGPLSNIAILSYLWSGRAGWTRKQESVSREIGLQR